MHEETFYVCDHCGVADADKGFIEDHESDCEGDPQSPKDKGAT